MIYTGDSLQVMPTLAPESVDAIVTDPPYGLSFMGKEWDHGVPGREFWEQALRVAKPGAHLLAFGGTRTFHRLACAIEDAGWEIRDCLQWIYGSGFPKSLDVGKAIDKAAGAEREVVGIASNAAEIIRRSRSFGNGNSSVGFDRPWMHDEEHLLARANITAPATDAAKQWNGWGTALKPSWEPIIMARKPLIGTVAENVQRYGTGALNIDACRVGTDVTVTIRNGYSGKYGRYGKDNRVFTRENPTGRWPANTLHDGSPEVLEGFPETAPAKAAARGCTTFGNGNGGRPRADGAIVKGHSDAGGSAARFFYCAKASKQDRDEGCEGLPETYNRGSGTHGNGTGTTRLGNAAEREAGITHVELSRVRNHHPTVKPTPLMRYLVRLVTPPGGLVLDPFMGSGSTGKACALEGFRFIGIELSPEYAEIARRRIAAAKGPLFSAPAQEDLPA